jgi:hypothetical protein
LDTKVVVLPSQYGTMHLISRGEVIGDEDLEVAVDARIR